MKSKLVAGIIAAMYFCFSMMLMAKPASAAVQPNKEIKVLLAYNPEYLKLAPNIMSAYESVLQEEGVSYSTIDVFQLAATTPSEFVKTSPAVIFPDAILQNVPVQLTEWTRKYLANGGNIAVIYDPGIKDDKGFYLEKSVFADIIGVNYITYGTKGAAAYSTGSVRFISNAALDFFQIPRGKTFNDLAISGYELGALTYPIARAEKAETLPESSIYAYGILKDEEKTPAIVLTDYGAGKVLYVNLPLGYMKSYEDDLLMRTTLRTFLFDVLQIPHVMSVAQGLGGVVLNWHVDSVVEWDTLPVMKRLGYLRKGINASIHITAGPDFIKVGDQEGFDACGMAKPLTRMLSQYGTVGSHGGWAHNWFADNIRSGLFKEKEIEEYIDKNNKCIVSVIGGRITEYSAPVGVHPQPVATRVLEKLGIRAYYYTGDMGSGPNRAFTEGQKISDNVIGFPVTAFGNAASFYEMHDKTKKTDAEVTEWLLSTLDYTSRQRVFRLLYSHPRDIGYYMEPIKIFLDQAERMQNKNELRVRSMTEVATFLLRFLKTSYSFSESENGLVISLKNAETLKDVTVAIPKNKYLSPVSDPKYIQEDALYYYVTVGGADDIEKTIFAPRR